MRLTAKKTSQDQPPRLLRYGGSTFRCFSRLQPKKGSGQEVALSHDFSRQILALGERSYRPGSERWAHVVNYSPLSARYSRIRVVRG